MCKNLLGVKIKVPKYVMYFKVIKGENKRIV